MDHPQLSGVLAVVGRLLAYHDSAHRVLAGTARMLTGLLEPWYLRHTEHKMCYQKLATAVGVSAGPGRAVYSYEGMDVEAMALLCVRERCSYLL